MGLRTMLQIGLGLRRLEPGGTAFAIHLVGHLRDILGAALEVIDAREGLRRLSERGMRRHIADELLAEADAPTVAQGSEVVLA